MSLFIQFLTILVIITLSKCDDFDNGTQKTSQCQMYGRVEIPFDGDKTLSKCYTHPNSTSMIPVMFELDDLSKFDYHYDVAHKLLCPIWAQNKKCLFDYFRAECDNENFPIIKRTLILNNGEVGFSALLCDGNYREVYRSALRNGLRKCMQSEYSELFKQIRHCGLSIAYPGRNETPDYKTFVTQYAHCIKPSVISCGKGNPGKEAELKILGNDIENAYLETDKRLWTEYENATKILNAAKNEGGGTELKSASTYAKLTFAIMLTSSYVSFYM